MCFIISFFPHPGLLCRAGLSSLSSLLRGWIVPLVGTVGDRVTPSPLPWVLRAAVPGENRIPEGCGVRRGMWLRRRGRGEERVGKIREEGREGGRGREGSVQGVFGREPHQPRPWTPGTWKTFGWRDFMATVGGVWLCPPPCPALSQPHPGVGTPPSLPFPSPGDSEGSGTGTGAWEEAAVGSRSCLGWGLPVVRFPRSWRGWWGQRGHSPCPHPALFGI